MAVPASEIKAVLKVFDSPEFEDWDEKTAAENIVTAVNEVREASKRFVVVANLKWPHQDNYHMWACGPFNTENQANAMGERFAADPYTRRGEGRWKTVPILPPASNSSRTAWDTIRPPTVPCCSLHHGWVKDDLDRWTWHRPPEGAVHWKAGW